MAGLRSFGAYIPTLRLPRDTIAKAWSRGSLGGERRVSNYDEDALTMAVEAATDCLRGVPREEVDGVFFASTTPTYKEKQSAALIAMALDLSKTVRTADFGHSLRAGTSALLAAVDAVKAGTLTNVLVIASDSRLGYPKTDLEQLFGDAAVAVLVSAKDGAVRIDGAVSLADEIMDVWRTDKDTYVKTWEDRFAVTYGYTQNVVDAARTLLQQSKQDPKGITKAALYSPDSRSVQGVARGLGLDAKTQLHPTLIDNVGNTGAAHALLVLVDALQEAKPGARILAASYGDGSDAFLLTATDAIAGVQKNVRGVKGSMAVKRTMPTYERYLAFRGIAELQPEPPLRIASFGGATVEYRDRLSWISMRGSRCRKCGTHHYPIHRVCYTCRAKDDYDTVRLSDKGATIFNYTLDNLAGGMDPPVIETVLESEAGACRVYCQMTDADPNEVKIGLPVEFTFRLMHEVAGFHNYFWKCRPQRGGK